MKQKSILTAFAIIACSIVFFSCSQNKDPHNSLTDEEQKDGWVMLFDGKTTNGWHIYNRGNIASNWAVRNGQLDCDPHIVTTAHNDLVSDKTFSNYDLKFEWSITKGGNSGVFINVQEDTAYGTPWVTGPEYQLLDNANSVDHNHNDTLRQAGCLYSLAPLKNHAETKPFGEWNEARILQQNSKVTFWLNGTLSAEEDMTTDRWKQLVAASGLHGFADFGKFTNGHLALQDWNKGVSFRNIKIKELK